MLEELQQALARLVDGPLRGGAAGLLETLGYRSERTSHLSGVAEFLDDFRAERLPAKQRALFDSWRAVDIVFQVTDDEIAEQTGQAAAFFDRGRIQSFLFLAVELAADAYNRTHLAETTRAVNRLLPMPALVFYRHGATLTLAVVHRRVHKRDAERDVLERITLIKDIRLADPHRAHLEILAGLALPRMREAGVGSFDRLHIEWERALDVEQLNRRFYGELFRWFERAVKQCRFPDDGGGQGCNERHVIRLITRLLFIWFLKEKGLVPADLFEEDFAGGALKRCEPAESGYYRAVLQNLFFATLNTAIDRRAFSTRDKRVHRDFNKYRCRALLADPEGFLAKLRAVPFVNGGLFECLDDFEGQGAGGRRIDAFTDNPAQHRDLSVPASLFFDAEGLFPLLRRYKFTVEENTPLDREIALDPELLGRVFENLLAAYNPETQQTARKATGSYYTPRHIVDYMVDEALTAALAAKARPADHGQEGSAAFWRERLRYLLDYEDAFDDAAELFDAGETESVVRAVAELRILDPAVGSGAFPMGVLHKLTLTLRRLDPHNALWERIQKEQAGRKAGEAFEAANIRARDEELLDISRIFEIYRDSDFGRKLYLMQNGIFGVDIQPVACQIAKLRFFISLVVEQRTNDDAQDNYGIRPLPNLETRFVAADALIGLGSRKRENGVLGSGDVERLEDHLRRVRERYFNARTRATKLKLRKQDAELRAALAEALQDLWRRGPETTRAVADWDPYDQNARAAWFDAEWMFGVTKGFDVVIGNPPYVRGEKIEGKAKLRAAFGDFYRGTADIYTYFFRRGVELLAGDGLLCFITSNKFMRAGYGEPLRAFLKREAPPISLLDLGHTGAFDATVRPAVMLTARNGGRETLRAAAVRDRGRVTDLGGFMEKNGFALPVAALPDKGWSLVEPALLRLRDKIEAAGEPLGEYAEHGLYRGIITGLNDAFVIDEETRERLIAEDPKSEELIKPWLRGRDVRRWLVNWAGLHVIFTRQGTNIERYPAIKRHLQQFRADLEPKTGRGAKQGRAPGSYKWFEIQAAIAYHEAFNRPRIVYPDIGTEMRAALDRKSRLMGNTCYMIPGDDGYLLALLNSKLMDVYFRLVMPCLDDPFSGGDMRFFRADMERAPIALAKSKTKRRLAGLANRIQDAQQADPGADTTADERELNRIVYDLYNLDATDAALIERNARH